MKIPWKLILIIFIGFSILFLVGSLTGANQKLFKMALDQVRADQSRVVKIQEESQEWYEEEMKKLIEERDQLKEEKLSVQMEKAQIVVERDALKGWVNELQKKRQVIVVSDDPDRIIGDLHKLGIGSIRRR